LRPTRASTLPFKASGDLRVGGRELPLGLLAPGLLVGGSVLAMMLSGDGASIAAAAFLGALALWFTLAGRHAQIETAREVGDAFVATILRLRSSDVYVGESATLSAADQARLLGEAWEQADKPDPLDVRLVIHHRSGRSETYHLGAHPPHFTPADLDLIHRVWLD